MSKFRTGYRAALIDVAEMLRASVAENILPLDIAQLAFMAPIGRTAELTLRHAAYIVESMPSDHQVIEASHETPLDLAAAGLARLAFGTAATNYSGSTPRGLYDTPRANDAGEGRS